LFSNVILYDHHFFLIYAKIVENTSKSIDFYSKTVVIYVIRKKNNIYYDRWCCEIDRFERYVQGIQGADFGSGFPKA
jgi:hypothetical protein